jgi:hypothetical protein
MVRMRVCDDHHVHPVTSPCAKQWLQHGEPWVNPTGDIAAAVDQHATAVREIDEQRISLTYVIQSQSKLSKGLTLANCRKFHNEKANNAQANERQSRSFVGD